MKYQDEIEELEELMGEVGDRPLYKYLIKEMTFWGKLLDKVSREDLEKYGIKYCTCSSVKEKK